MLAREKATPSIFPFRATNSAISDLIRRNSTTRTIRLVATMMISHPKKWFRVFPGSLNFIGTDKSGSNYANDLESDWALADRT